MQHKVMLWLVMNPLATPESKFVSQIQRGSVTQCWEWTGTKDAQGYGHCAALGGETLAHRAAFKLRTGITPGKLFVCHKCDNPPCCNPDHLFIGTAGDNIRDSIRKGRRKPSLNSKLSSGEADAIREIWAASGKSFAEIGRLYGVQRQAIRRICRGLTYSAP